MDQVLDEDKDFPYIDKKKLIQALNQKFAQISDNDTTEENRERNVVFEVHS